MDDLTISILRSRVSELEAALEQILKHPAGLAVEQGEIACAALDGVRTMTAIDLDMRRFE